MQFCYSRYVHSRNERERRTDSETWYNWWSKTEEHTFVYNLHGGYLNYILIVCCTIILDIFIIVIIGFPILNCMIHYNVCNEKGNYCAILWASGNYCGRLELVIPLGDWL